MRDVGMRRVTTEISKIIDNNDIVGSGRLTEDCIHNLEVDSDYRRHGFATEILRELIQLGGKRLWVKTDNNAAISLYKKIGFVIFKEDGGYYEMRLP